MSNADRIGKECVFEILPWCPKCGDYLDMPGHAFASNLKRHENFSIVCECGVELGLESEIVLSAKVSKESKS